MAAAQLLQDCTYNFKVFKNPDGLKSTGIFLCALSGQVGEMYVGGGEMTTNIDVAGGKGCAEFVSKAIKIYCK